MNSAPGPSMRAAWRRNARRLVRLEIADGRAGKEPDPPAMRRKRSRQLGDRGEIGRDRVDGEPREIAAQLGRFLLQILARNVDRHIGFDRRRGAH